MTHPHIRLRLFNEDCLAKMKEIPMDAVDLLICDLPYGQTDAQWDKKIDLNQFWFQINRVCKVSCAKIFYCSTKFGYELIKSNQKEFRYDLVWEKSRSVGFLNAKKMPLRQHEMIYVFYKKLPFYNITAHKKKVFEKIERRNANINNVYQSPNLIENYINRKGAVYEPPLPTSVIKCKNETNRTHSTSKPIELYKFLIQHYSKEDDIVLDPTMGSGGCGVASMELNRKFIGIEINNAIFNVAYNRLISDSD